jgi:sulfite exporter TauE/SafE
MCGPLACALRAQPLEYHGGRLVSYTLAGAFSGFLGGGVLAFLQADGSRVAPWVLVASLLMIALGVERRLPQPAFLSRWLFRLRINRSLGLVTPLLPCGPLWLMLGAAATTGSWLRGSGLMAAFVLGTVPLPLFVQLNATWLWHRCPPATLHRMQRVVALIATVILTWRALVPIHAACH